MKLFETLDFNGDKSLQLDEIVEAMRQIGLKVSHQEMRKLFGNINEGSSKRRIIRSRRYMLVNGSSTSALAPTLICVCADITFEQFVTEFASTKEWDKLFEIKKRREELGVEEAPMSFNLWIPAFHRQTMLKNVPPIPPPTP